MSVLPQQASSSNGLQGTTIKTGIRKPLTVMIILITIWGPRNLHRSSVGQGSGVPKHLGAAGASSYHVVWRRHCPFHIITSFTSYPVACIVRHNRNTNSFTLGHFQCKMWTFSSGLLNAVALTSCSLLSLILAKTRSIPVSWIQVRDYAAHVTCSMFNF
jgi:hypothetical protein